MRPLNELLRPHIAKITPYSSARSEYPGSTASALHTVFLDANENAFGSPLEEVDIGLEQSVHRYPDPLQQRLKERIAALKHLSMPNAEQYVFLGNGSDEPIDLLIRAFCEPAHNAVIITPPTYGMYEVSASIHNAPVLKVPLIRSETVFAPDVERIVETARQTPDARILFLCSPNNPTGNVFDSAAIEALITGFEGIVVLDEAYIDFAPEHSFLPKLTQFPNLVILQTFSKAWGLAGLRLGMAFAAPEIIKVLNTIKPPYNIGVVTQELALEALMNETWKTDHVRETAEERTILVRDLAQFPFVEQIFPSNANFLLVKVQQPRSLYEHLVQNGVIVRDRSTQPLCEGCLRITIGTQQENKRLLTALRSFRA